ncbi:MAG: OmpA family protein [Pseudomonadota bacterium]
MNQPTKYIALAAWITSFTLLQACATSVSKLSGDGKSDEIIFPDIAKSAWVKEGTFPNIDNLRNVAPDMTKNQLYTLLGHPHFTEGIGKVREWDYIFNFRASNTASAETCQYKIIYTADMRVQNTYWKPESCAHWLDSAAALPQTVVEKTVEKLVPGPELTKTQMSADGMFDFDHSEIAHLRPGGIEKLDRLSANLLSGGQISALKITAHTDRLGDDDYNMKLSQARADTLRQYLINKNIPAERISAVGVGESTPLVECKQTQRDEVLIRCLEPNRRFEIEAWTSSKL